MTRKFPKLSMQFKEDHMKKQASLAQQVEKRQAGETKDWKAGMLNIQAAQRKANHEVKE